MARKIRRRSQQVSQDRQGMGVSELFLGRPSDVERILAAHDTRLKLYLLGY